MDATASEPRAALRVASLFTPARVAAIAVIGSIPAKVLSDRLIDPDLWWHLRTGALIVQTKGVPQTDPYSYTAGGQPWVVQQWASEVFLHGLRKAFGLYGILFYRAIALVLLYLLVSRLFVRRMGGGMGTWALLAIVAYAGAPNWTERPNLISFVFFTLTLWLLERPGRSAWWIVPLSAVWANVHGMVVLGIGLVALVAVSEWIKVGLGWRGEDREWAKTLGLVTVASLMATFLNPEGFGLLTHAARLTRIAQGIAQEWQSPSFHQAGPILFLALLCLTILGFALNPKRPDLTDLLLTFAFTGLALQAQRNLAVGAIVLGLVSARRLPGVQLPVRPREDVQAVALKPVAASSGAMLGVAGFVVAVAGLAIVAVSGFPASARPADIVDRAYPIATIDMLDRPGVRVFSHDFWSGMVIDRACGPVVGSPPACANAKVFVDLRWDFYGLEIADRYSETIVAKPAWRRHLGASCTTHVLIQPDDPLTQIIRDADEWRVVRRDRRSVLFERNAPAPGCERFPIPRLG